MEKHHLLLVKMMTMKFQVRTNSKWKVRGKDEFSSKMWSLCNVT